MVIKMSYLIDKTSHCSVLLTFSTSLSLIFMSFVENFEYKKMHHEIVAIKNNFYNFVKKTREIYIKCVTAKKVVTHR